MNSKDGIRRRKRCTSALALLWLRGKRMQTNVTPPSPELLHLEPALPTTRPTTLGTLIMALRATFRLLMSYGLRAPLVPLSLRGARNFILTTLPLVMVSLLFATAVLRSDCKSTSATFTKRPPRPSQMFKSGEWCLTAKNKLRENCGIRN